MESSSSLTSPLAATAAALASAERGAVTTNNSISQLSISNIKKNDGISSSIRIQSSLPPSPSQQEQQQPNGKGEESGGSISPVYWQPRHNRSESYASQQSIDDTRGGSGRGKQGITLEDHTEEPSESSGSLWAKGISIEDYVVVRGSSTGIGAYVVWNCRVETLDVGVLFPGAEDPSKKFELI